MLGRPDPLFFTKRRLRQTNGKVVIQVNSILSMLKQPHKINTPKAIQVLHHSAVSYECELWVSQISHMC